MRIIYVANVRLPTEKAHGLQIMKTCESFARLGHSVTILAPKRRNTIRGNPFSYYKVDHSFSIIYVPCIDLPIFDRLAFFIQYMTYSIAVSFRKELATADVVYGRDELALACIGLMRRVRIVWESHSGAWNFAARYVARRASLLVVTTRGLKHFYMEAGVKIPIFAISNGIDLEEFSNSEDKASARKRLGIPLDKKVAMYVGRLDQWKGIETLCESAAYLPARISLVVIGGEPAEVTALQKRFPVILFLGPRPYRELAANQAAADVLVLPNSAHSVVSTRFTSPLKAFAYMSSGRPIVASDLPSIREILDETMAYFVPPDDPRALAESIDRASNDSSAHIKAQNALEHVRQFTWQKRAERILRALSA